jgi:hypothetical protein
MHRGLLIFTTLITMLGCSGRVPEAKKLANDSSGFANVSPSASPETSVITTWQVHTNKYGNTAWVGARGTGPNGEIQATLSIQCPAQKNDLTTIELIVHRTGEIPDFDFDNFEGPDAPNADKDLITIRTDSDTGKSESKVSASGWYGGRGEADAFVFAAHISSRIARDVAVGKVRISFVVQDANRSERTLEATFPKMDPSSDVATMLNGCRK